MFAVPLSAAEAYSVRHQGVDFDVVRLRAGEEQDLRFFWKRDDGTPYASILAVREELLSRGEDLVFAVNGGIFSEEYTPLGLYIEDGRRFYQLNEGSGGGNFFLQPNGVFYVTAEGAAVVDTRDYDPSRPVRHAVQSGPLLVTNGRLHPRFIPGYHSKHIRHGVGVDAQGRVVFAISDSPVNFHDFGTLFRDVLECPNALYLDGSLSAMYAPEVNRYGGWPWQRFTTIIGLVAKGATAPVSGP
jgi:uncharacterized protein YigE (DUF2233 family)